MIARLVGAAIGIWLLVAPAVIHHGPTGSDQVRTLGLIVASLAFVALWPAANAGRWATLPLGAWLVATPLLVDYDSTAAALNAVASGMTIVAVAPMGSNASRRLGGG